MIISVHRWTRFCSLSLFGHFCLWIYIKLWMQRNAFSFKDKYIITTMRRQGKDVGRRQKSNSKKRRKLWRNERKEKRFVYSMHHRSTYTYTLLPYKCCNEPSKEIIKTTRKEKNVFHNFRKSFALFNALFSLSLSPSSSVHIYSPGYLSLITRRSIHISVASGMVIAGSRRHWIYLAEPFAAEGLSTKHSSVLSQNNKQYWQGYEQRRASERVNSNNIGWYFICFYLFARARAADILRWPTNERFRHIVLMCIQLVNKLNRISFIRSGFSLRWPGSTVSNRVSAVLVFGPWQRVSLFRLAAANILFDHAKIAVIQSHHKEQIFILSSLFLIFIYAWPCIWWWWRRWSHLVLR